MCVLPPAEHIPWCTPLTTGVAALCPHMARRRVVYSSRLSWMEPFLRRLALLPCQPPAGAPCTGKCDATPEFHSKALLPFLCRCQVR